MGTPAANVQSPISLNANYRSYLLTSQISVSSPGNRFVFIDVNPASICTPAFGVDMTGDDWVHYPSAFHRKKGVLSYADGRIESRKWKDPRTDKGIPPGAQYIPHGDPSPGNQDLYWLRTQTTTTVN
jgi:hypothetical protein